MARIIPELFESIPEMVQAFATILGASVPQAILVLCGALLVGVSVLIMGYLTAGAIVSPLVSVSPRGREYQ
ncbi:hypothetical protein [Halocatena pleomorpha]|uniref:Uncharacterized protein n=1 Tax=Halocatena pleomorpha TaxID=1785090 RepID=A0A3P3R5J1_9EURY|nr:hypothetical protein [Halocatena pleomorpha]RRJ28635.1 hypothetical protein EIK79_15205 [Halocatena pleomorpha]